MRKKLLTAALAVTMTLAMSMTALAGQWKSDASGWWWENDGGGYPVSTWQWIDGNGDGVAESYYFDSRGYCLLNTTTPDGYAVNAAGAWVVDGVIQTKAVEAAAGGQENHTATDKLNLWKVLPVQKNCTKGEKLKTSDENLVYDMGWSFFSSWFGDQYVIFANEHQGYNYLTVTFAPGNGMSKSSIGTFVVKGDYEDEDTQMFKDGDILEEENFMYDDGPQTVTVDISGYDLILIGLRHNSADASMVIPDMYFHN